MKTAHHSMSALARIRNAAAFAVALLLLGPAAAAPATDPQLIEIAAGGQTVMKLEKAAKRVAIGSGDIAEAKVLDDRQLLLQGIKPGETTLLVWTRNDAPPRNYRVVVNRATGNIPGPAGENLQLKAAGDLLVLNGTARDMQQHEVAKEAAEHSGGENKVPVADASQLSYGGEVQIEVRVVEFSRKVMKQAGLSILSNRTGFTFGTFPNGSLNKVQLADGKITTEANLPISQAFNLVTGHSSKGFVSILSMLEGNGFARTLAQPVLVAQSGQSADFLAGGEFPVPVPQALGQTTIQYKPFGIRLDVSPTVLGENRIALRVAPEVSDLNFDNAITINGVSVPSLMTRRTSTSVELGNGESFVIGGLVSQTMMKNIDKIPGLGDVPVLGAFFKSASLSREDKELLFIVTPRLVRPLAANAQLPALPGADKADYNPSLWRMLLLSDSDEAASHVGLSR